MTVPALKQAEPEQYTPPTIDQILDEWAKDRKADKPLLMADANRKANGK